ncbi:MAG TPA: hypothetical protein VHX62_05600 [Solirubrobacteraceae bacterium]|jgi:hypothetical protein|nr:hypothetical protein [Solirubrobacteraceae bacterium]
MKIKRRWAVLVAVVVAGAGVSASAVLATPQAGLTTSTVASAPFAPIRVEGHYRPDPQTQPPSFWAADLRTFGVSDVYVVDNVLSPGGTTGWHTHPGPSLIIVKSGTVTNYRAWDGRCAAYNYPAGTGFIDSGGNDIHMLKNNGTVPAETVAIQLIPHGQPRKIDEPQPPNCPS